MKKRLLAMLLALFALTFVLMIGVSATDVPDDALTEVTAEEPETAEAAETIPEETREETAEVAFVSGNWETIDGKTYYVDTNGDNVTGVVYCKKPGSSYSYEYYYFDENGVYDDSVVCDKVGYSNGDCFYYYKDEVLTFTGEGTIEWVYQYKDHPAKKVIVEEGIVEIDDNGFYKMTSIESVTLPDSLTTLGDDIFNGCTGLKKIVIPASVTSLGNDIFKNCTQLTTVGPIGSNSSIEFGWTTSIPTGAFYGLDGATITIPDTVTTVGSRAFTCKSTIHLSSKKLTIEGSSSTYPSTAPTFVYKGSETCWKNNIGATIRTDGEGVKRLYASGYDAAIQFAEDCLWDKGKITKEPTCTNEGTKTFTCTFCGNTKTSVVKANGHKWDDGTVITPATATSRGFKTYNCTVCKEIKEEVLPATGGGKKNPFTDNQKSSNFYYTPVIWAYNNGVTTGTSDTTFSPTMACSRAQIVTFLWRAQGCPKPETTVCPFKDVKKGWYYDAVLWASEKGITTGTSATTFSPDTIVTRNQFVTFLWRVAGKPAVDGQSAFSDVKKSDSTAWYYDAVVWASKKGIATGTGGGKFAPGMNCDRGQTVTFLYRYYENKPVTTVSGLILNATSVSLDDFANQTFTLEVTASVPDGAKADKVTWTSSDTSVVKVSSKGVLTRVGGGTATITATCGTGVATCKVTYEETDVDNYVNNDYRRLVSKKYADFKLMAAAAKTYVDARGHDVVATTFWYKAKSVLWVDTIYSQVTVHDLTEGKYIDDADEYYEKKAEGLYGTSKLTYMKLASDALGVKAAGGTPLATGKGGLPYQYTLNSYGLLERIK